MAKSKKKTHKKLPGKKVNRQVKSGAINQLELWSAVYSLMEMGASVELGEELPKRGAMFADKVLIALKQASKVAKKEMQNTVAIGFVETLAVIYKLHDSGVLSESDRRDSIEKWTAGAEKIFGPMTQAQRSAFHKPTSYSKEQKKQKKISLELQGLRGNVLSGAKRNAYERMKFCFSGSRKSALHAFKKRSYDSLPKNFFAESNIENVLEVGLEQRWLERIETALAWTLKGTLNQAEWILNSKVTKESASFQARTLILKIALKAVGLNAIVPEDLLSRGSVSPLNVK